MARTRVTLNRAGVAKILKSDKVAAELHRRAERAAEAARASAPVASGKYKASIEVADEQHPTRVVSRVYARVPYAMTVEANTGNLARAIDAAGGA